MRIAVAIACYGHSHDKYLARLLQEYGSMQHQMDVYVLSNIPRDLGPDVRVVVGLPDKNPLSLPYAHKKLFADLADQYDVFIYSEDDILITQRNIDAFVEATAVLPQDEIAGFMATETAPDGTISFCNVHTHFYWDPTSVRRRGPYTFAYFTNEHSATFILTQDQLKRAIARGGFLHGVRKGRYSFRVTAATDPYTQCGMKKQICISHLDDFLVRHLPNKYIGTHFGLSRPEFEKQIRALLEISKNGRSAERLFQTETKLLSSRWSKFYYEPPQKELVAEIPDGVRSILSLGCGWGEMEKYFVDKGMRVVGVPLDAVIAACAEEKGIQIAYGSFETARRKLGHDRFDCILLSNVLHLLDNPPAVLFSFAELLTPDGVVVASMPNFSWLRTILRRWRHRPHLDDLGNYDKTGMHLSNKHTVREWLKQSGLRADKISFTNLENGRPTVLESLGLAANQLASDLVVVARRA